MTSFSRGTLVLSAVYMSRKRLYRGCKKRNMANKTKEDMDDDNSSE